MRTLDNGPRCMDRHCPHSLLAPDGSGMASSVPTANVAWCCRCENVLCVPPNLDFEEKTHGVNVPRLLPWRAFRETPICMTCGADVTHRCGCSAPLVNTECSRDRMHAQTTASAVPRCWCRFRPEDRTGRFAKNG